MFVYYAGLCAYNSCTIDREACMKIFGWNLIELVHEWG